MTHPDAPASAADPARRAAHLLYCRTPTVASVPALLVLVLVIERPWSLLAGVLWLVGALLVRRLCVYCAADLPLDPTGLVHRYRRSLWLYHRGLLRLLPSQPVMALASFGCLSLPGLAAMVVTVNTHQPAWMGIAALYATVLPWLLLTDVIGRHSRIRPWCPWCRGDDDPHLQPDPDPDPAGTQPYPVNA